MGKREAEGKRKKGREHKMEASMSFIKLLPESDTPSPRVDAIDHTDQP